MSRLREPANIRPEERLLCACARTVLDPPAHMQVQACLVQPIEWAYLQQIAEQHGVAALVYQGMVASGVTAPSGLPALRAQAQAGTQRSLFLTAELLRLLHCFEAAGIAALPLKGAVLAATAYQNIGLRQFADLDILVGQGDLARARQLLYGQGYQLEEQIDAAREPAYLHTQHHFTFTRADGVIVELHYRLRERFFAFPLDMDGLWARAGDVLISGQRVRRPVTEDALLMLCVHGAGHYWDRLIWICDIAALLQSAQPIEWDDVLIQARALGTERMLLLGLLLAFELFGTRLPEVVLVAMRADRALPALAQQVLDRLFRVPEDARGLGETAWFYLRCRERYADRVRFVLRLVFTPTLGDWSLVRLPRALSFVYYLLRPLRLLALLVSRRLEHNLD